MKIRTTLLIALAALIFIGCTNSKTGVQHRPIADKSKIFRVDVGAIVPKTDDFSLFYTTDGSINFTKIPPIWKNVKGNLKLQSTVFILPEGVAPTMIRIDLGRNQKQEKITLKWIKLSYNGKAVDIPGTYIFSYFRPNLSSTKSDAMTGEISGIIKNGVRQTPSLYPKEGPLSEQIEFLTEE